MEKADAPCVVLLAEHLGYAASTVEVRDRLGELLGSQDHLWVVATDATAIVIGWLHALVERRIEVSTFVQIAAVVVDDTRRSEGVGAILVEAAGKWARDNGITQVRLSSNSSRARAHSFYQRLGYSNTSASQWFTKSLVAPE